MASIAGAWAIGARSHGIIDIEAPVSINDKGPAEGRYNVRFDT